MKRTVRFTLNSRKFGSQTTVEGVHVGDDNSCELIISVTDGNKILDLSSETTVATMCGTKPDGTVISRRCSIIDNNIVYTLEKQDTAVSGNVLYQVTVVSDDGISQSIIATAKFTVAVMKNIYIPIYRVLESEPSDWSTNYTAYYRLIDNKYVAVSDSSCPAFLKDTFYYLVNPNFNSKDDYGAFQSALVRVENLIGRASDILTTLDSKINDVEAEHISNKVSAVDFRNLSATEYPNITALYNYHTNYVDPCYDDIDNLENSKADKATSLAGYGITDAYTSEEVDNLLTALGTKNFSFLRDSFGRIIDYTRDTRITSTSFKLYNSNDLSKGYSAWFGETVNYVENGALDIANLKEIVCENTGAVLESDYDDVKISKSGKNPYSEYYKLISLAKLYNEKANKATTYTKSEVDTKLSGKLDNTAGSVTTDNIASKAVTKEKLNDDVKDMLYMTSTQNWENALVGTAKTGGFFFDSTGKKIVTNKYSGALISVKGGDKIKVSARTSSASPYLVTFYSDYTYIAGTAQGESYTFLEGYGIASTDYNDEEITVPVGAKYAGVNSYITGDTAIPLSVYKLADIVYDTPVKSAVKDKLNNRAGAVVTDNIANGAITELKLADDVRTKLQKVVNTLPKCMLLPDGDNTRALYVNGRYLYHCHATNRAVTKCDIGIECAPENIETIGGHAKTYPRGMAVGNGYLYVPYRDTKGGTGTSFDSATDVGGYLDIINLSNFTLANTIAYHRNPYDPGDGRGIRYYGKSHNAATYNDKYLCVTQQLGGWLLYDISEKPVISDEDKPLYKCDNRAQSTIDNTEFQQPAFYTDGTMVFLAITGYDRHLLKIYNLNDPTYPICVYSGDLRELWQHGDTAYLHAMGLVCKYPYIYCSVAPHPACMTDFENTIQGVAVVDVSDINRVKVNFYKIPDESRTINSGGEPSPQSIAVTKNHLVMDMFDKGVSVWSLANPAEPKFLGNLDTGATKVCSVLSTEDGRTFIGTEYQGGNLTMYRGL